MTVARGVVVGRTGPARIGRELRRGARSGQAEILRLAYYEDISHSDIAARIGVPLGTVKSRLRLAMARLRSRFSEQA